VSMLCCLIKHGDNFTFYFFHFSTILPSKLRSSKSTFSFTISH